MIAIASIAVMAIYAQKNEKVTIDDERLIKLEALAEQGDTTAMHTMMKIHLYMLRWKQLSNLMALNGLRQKLIVLISKTRIMPI